MSITLPSKKIVEVNAPEVSDFTGKFVYNFFMKDEKTNETETTYPEFVTKIPAEKLDAEYSSDKNFQNKIPRYNLLKWRPSINISQNNVIEKYYFEKYLANKISIKNNLNKIQYENDFISKDFLRVTLQDTTLDEKLNFYVRRLLDELQENFGTTQESYLDVAKTLNSLTSNQIKGNYLAQILFDLKSYGVTYIDKQNREKVAQTLISNLKQIKTDIKINNKFLTHVGNSIFENPNSIYQDEMSLILDEFNNIQENAVQSSNSSILNNEDYDLVISNYLDVKAATKDYDTIVIPVGYIIDKFEILSDKTRNKKESIIIENPFNSSVLDLKIKYDSKYAYSIRTIVYTEAIAQDQDSGEYVTVSFLISSQASEEVYITCEESLPPPYPSDFNVVWDFTKQGAFLSWSFPLNSQRDIKYFQVLRRQTIDEPFELIKMYDFDDSEVPSDLLESPEGYLIETLDSPKTYYFDNEFNKESKFIYALCSIDAHGFTSPYSMQFEISFDKFKNKINKKLISVGGAPKSYPNMFLDRDTFVDTIKDSGHKRLKIYFNPEYLEVTKGNNSPLNLLKTSENSFYRLQMINIDLQKQQIVDINLEDRRTTIEKNNMLNDIKNI